MTHKKNNTTLKIHNIGLDYDRDKLEKQLSYYGSIVSLRIFCYNKKEHIYKNVDLCNDKVNYDCVYNCYVTYMNHDDAVKCMNELKNYKLSWAKLEKNSNKILYISNIDVDKFLYHINNINENDKNKKLNDNLLMSNDYINIDHKNFNNMSLNINYHKNIIQLTHYKSKSDNDDIFKNIHNIFKKFGDIEYINLHCVKNKNYGNTSNEPHFYYLFVKYTNIYDSCKARYYDFRHLLGDNVIVKYKSQNPQQNKQQNNQDM